MNELTFEPEGHVYRFGGRVVPSVTQVLEPLQMLQGVPWALLESAREFGTHVHLACHLWNKGELDQDALDPALAPYLAGWISFLKETGFVIYHSEHRVYHRTLRYAGTADAFGTWNESAWVIDIKSGIVPGTVGAQLAAYSQASNYPRAKRLCVQLSADGLYRLHPQKDPSDFALFTSALNVWKYLNKRSSSRVHEHA